MSPAPPAPTEVAEVVVTATRTAQPIEKVGASVTVLTEPVIQASQAISVTELLAQTPSVTFARNGGVGSANQPLYPRPPRASIRSC